MTIVQLVPPIAVATFVALLWSLVAFGLYRRDRERPSESLSQAIWLILMPGALGTYLYLHGRDAPISTGPQIFMTALIGLLLGAVLVFTLYSIFFDPINDRRNKIVHGVYLVMLLSLFTGLMFI